MHLHSQTVGQSSLAAAVAQAPFFARACLRDLGSPEAQLVYCIDEPSKSHLKAHLQVELAVHDLRKNDKGLAKILSGLSAFILFYSCCSTVVELWESQLNAHLAGSIASTIARTAHKRNESTSL